MKKTLYLHIGAHRTGTTYLQTCLHRNRDALAGHGIDTVSDLSLWGQGHHNVAFSYLQWALRDAGLTREQYLERFRTRLKESALGSIIISSEFFELFDDAAVERLRADLGGFGKVVVYGVRNQPQYLESYYRESFKQGLTESFESWMKERVAAGLGDFHAIAHRWVAGLGADAVRIVVYENLLRENLNIFEYFAHRILLVPERQALDLPAERIINGSADRRLLWLLREMNRRHGRPENHVAGIGAQYLRLRRRLERIYDASPSLAAGSESARIIDAAAARSIAAQFEASNARLLAEFGSAICNPTSDGTLFPAPALVLADTDAGIESGRLETSVLLDLLFRALAEDEEGFEPGAAPDDSPRQPRR